MRFKLQNGGAVVPQHWKVLLTELEEPEAAADVVTRDGEILGTWSIADGVFYTFTPDGAEDHIFFEPFFGILCQRITEWYEARESDGADRAAHQT